MTDIKYKVINGTSYHEETSDEVIRILENSRIGERRIKFCYGDIATGKDWNEIFDVTGTIGRSMGPTKIPILLHNSRSIGGGAILDHCIIKICESKGGKVLYQQPNYHKETE